MAFSERNSWRAPEQDALLDDVSLQIIKELQADGRRPYTAIAKAVGLSEAAVRQRVQRLLDSGIMQIVAITDPLRVGYYIELDFLAYAGPEYRTAIPDVRRRVQVLATLLDATTH